MSYFVVQVGNISIKNLVRLKYTRVLNEISEFEFFVDGTTSTERTELVKGATVEIYRNGTLEFDGKIRTVRYSQGGGVLCRGYCTLEVMARDEYATATTWKKATETTTSIFQDILGFSSTWTYGTISASAVAMDFRVSDTQTVWNALGSFLTQSGYEIVPNYSTKKIDLVASAGTSNSFLLNEGTNITNVTFERRNVDVSKVEVYGKGDGDTQITGSYGSGTPIRRIHNPNIITPDQADKLAEAEYNRLKNGEDFYEFEVITPDLNIDLGDTGDLLAPSCNITSATTVAVTKIVRGIKNGIEYLSLQVTNTELRRAKRNKDSILAEAHMNQKLQSTSMQGTTNVLTFSNVRNGNNTVGCTIECPLPSSFIIDEAGNKRVLNMTLDYDIDPFNRQYGGASATSDSPDVENDSGENYERSQVAESANWATAISPFGSSGKILDVTPNVHGDGMYITINLRAYNFSTPTSAISFGVYIYNSTDGDYYPDSNGLYIVEKKERWSTDSDTHTHPAHRNYFVESDDMITFYGYSPTVSDSHSHTVDVDVTGEITVFIPIDPYNKNIEVYLTGDSSNSCTVYTYVSYYIISQHKHDDGNYNAESHNHSPISIGDAVSDAGSVNATQITVDLQRLESGSWVSHYSQNVSLSGATYGTDLDLTNGGTYPDDSGFWRVVIKTNSSNPDLIKGVVKVKHQMDN